MIIRIENGRIITDGEIREAYVYIENGKILAVTKDEMPFDESVDAQGLYVSPGFIDMHTHGAIGVDFTRNGNTCTAEESAENFARAVDFHMTHGTTTILPTITASSMQTMINALDAMKVLIDGNLAKANIPGAHMEGPYFSPTAAGAQDPQFITDPIPADYTALTEKYGKIIRRWSYAPERDHDQSFTRYLMEHDILPAAGHTDAIYTELKPAFEAGCRLVTHLYSCTSTITRDHGFRRLGVIECAYLWDDMDVEIIADGCHLPPELIKLIVKLKGVDRVSLVTDSLQVAGTTAKESSCGTTKCIIEDGVCKLLDRSAFAGSIATMDRLVRVCTKDAGIPLADTVTMAATTPARVLGLNKGRIAAGFDADILFFDEDVNIKRVFVDGKTVHEA